MGSPLISLSARTSSPTPRRTSVPTAHFVAACSQSSGLWFLFSLSPIHMAVTPAQSCLFVIIRNIRATRLSDPVHRRTVTRTPVLACGPPLRRLQPPWMGLEESSALVTTAEGGKFDVSSPRTRLRAVPYAYHDPSSALTSKVLRERNGSYLPKTTRRGVARAVGRSRGRDFSSSTAVRGHASSLCKTRV